MKRRKRKRSSKAANPPTPKIPFDGEKTAGPSTALAEANRQAHPGDEFIAPVDAERPGSDPTAPAGADRRTHPRYEFTAAAEVVAAESGARMETRVRDLSQRGCYVDTNNVLPLGTVTDMRITKETQLFEAAARVAGEEKAVFPAADQLLEKYLAAVGGAEALQKITSRVQKGTLIAFGGQHFPVDVYSKAPDRRFSVMQLQGGGSVTAFNGKQGWLSVLGHVHIMSAAENDAARMDAELYLPAHLKTLYQKFSVDAGEKIDGRDTYLVVGHTEGQPPLRLYLDKESGLLLRLVRYGETPLGRNPTQIDYSDYRDANGVKVSFRWTLARPGNRFTIQVEELLQNVPVDDAKFAPPPPPPSPAPKPSAP